MKSSDEKFVIGKIKEAFCKLLGQNKNTRAKFKIGT